MSIIGAGRVGQTLGRMAREAGYQIGDVICRSSRSARAAARFVGGGRPGSRAEASLSATDLVLISCPDDEIGDAVELIKCNQGCIGPSVVLHTSGALDSRVLKSLKRFGMNTGSCHPLQTFVTPAGALEMIQSTSTFFCIEGDRRATLAARRFVRDIRARYFQISTESKGLYHSAAVLASGGVVALVSKSLDLLVQCGLSEHEARRVLLPLVSGTVANLSALGPARALTGPLRRADVGTVRRNLGSLTNVDAKAAELYRLLADQGLSLAERAGTDQESLARLKSVLSKRRS